MGNNEIKEIIQIAVANSAGLIFNDNFRPIENGKLMRTLSFKGDNRISDEKAFIYNSQAPSENELIRDLLIFIKPYLVFGICSKTIDANKF
jgi:hypothetical protein